LAPGEPQALSGKGLEPGSATFIRPRSLVRTQPPLLLSGASAPQQLPSTLLDPLGVEGGCLFFSLPFPLRRRGRLVVLFVAKDGRTVAPP
jgi:hypothetical protein